MKAKKLTAEQCGYDPNVLPELLEDIVVQMSEYERETLQQQGRRKSQIEARLRGIRTEALHYWEEACNHRFETAAEFIAHAMQAFRMRYADILREIGGEE